jgi:hypothetical protein
MHACITITDAATAWFFVFDCIGPTYLHGPTGITCIADALYIMPPPATYQPSQAITEPPEATKLPATATASIGKQANNNTAVHNQPAVDPISVSFTTNLQHAKHTPAA